MRRIARIAPVAVAAAGALLAAALVAGCGSRQGLEAPEVRYGHDICAACNMIVGEERFATALVTDAGRGAYEAFIFDDAGCMFQFERSRPGSIVLRRYVHDYEDRRWIEAKGALYVRSPEVRSPMGSGILCCDGRERALRLLERFAGELLSYDELKSLDREKGLLRPPPAAGGAGEPSGANARI